jgi:ParB family chromosome partitioning protein
LLHPVGTVVLIWTNENTYHTETTTMTTATETKTTVARKTKFIALANVIANPNQPRKDFDDAHIRELASSIAKHGLIQPISVRPIEKAVGKTTTYMIIAGECRYRAHKLLAEEGKLDAPVVEAIVSTDVDDTQMQVLAIIENAKRKDVNPMEEADAFQFLLDTGMTIAQVQRELGFGSRGRVTDRLNLLKLEDNAKTLVRSGQLSACFAAEIATLPAHMHTRMIRKVSTGEFKSIDQIRAACSAIREANEQGSMLGGAPAATDGEMRTLRSMEARIDDVLKMVNAGFKDGECQIAKKADPNRTTAMADKLAAVRSAITVMEFQLRKASAVADLLETAA